MFKRKIFRFRPSGAEPRTSRQYVCVECFTMWVETTSARDSGSLFLAPGSNQLVGTCPNCGARGTMRNLGPELLIELTPSPRYRGGRSPHDRDRITSL